MGKVAQFDFALGRRKLMHVVPDVPVLAMAHLKAVSREDGQLVIG